MEDRKKVELSKEGERFPSCTDCASHSSFDARISNVHCCWHEKMVTEDYVLGAVVAANCYECRVEMGVCGHEGKYFEQRTEFTWQERLMKWLGRDK